MSAFGAVGRGTTHALPGKSPPALPFGTSRAGGNGFTRLRRLQKRNALAIIMLRCNIAKAKLVHRRDVVMDVAHAMWTTTGQSVGCLANIRGIAIE